MSLKSEYQRHIEALMNFSDYPAVEYKAKYSLLNTPYDDTKLSLLRERFLKSDIVEEMYQTQDNLGGWGDLDAKDYSVKAKIPTTTVGIRRCLYIGLTENDRGILHSATGYLEDVLSGAIKRTQRGRNERAVPWEQASVCELMEAITPNNHLCDKTYDEWHYIASCAYESGEYSYERDRKAQHEVFWTREDRLVPMQSGLLLKRRERISPSLENAMLRHLGGIANVEGHFWEKTPDKLPESFYGNKTRRWFHTFNYINQFRGSGFYLAHAVEWLLENSREDGLWDWGPQVNDPFGYFGYFSLNRHYAKNRVIDCTTEVLNFLGNYIANNEN